MNATKALLSSKNINFNPLHGVKKHNTGGGGGKISIANERVKIGTVGIVPSLVNFYQEPETSRIHSLKELFYNLPFIHRTYCLSYKTQTEMFLPLTDCFFHFKKDVKKL